MENRLLYNPTLQSVLMVEETIEKHSGEYGKYQIWKSLPRKVMYQTFQVILDYLVKSKKIVIDKKYKEEFDKYLQKKLKKTDNKIWFERKNINNLSVNINNNMDGFVVISENFYPGWTAKVNGIKRKIIKVNGFFKGVFLESGKNVLELEYKPIILNVGFMLSLFVILF